MRSRDDAEYLAPAALYSFVLHTGVGRVAGAAYLIAAALLGLVLHALDASEPTVLAALTFLAISVPPVMSPLAEWAHENRRSVGAPVCAAEVGVGNAGPQRSDVAAHPPPRGHRGHRATRRASPLAGGERCLGDVDGHGTRGHGRGVERAPVAGGAPGTSSAPRPGLAPDGAPSL